MTQEPIYTIHMAAEIIGLHEQSLRMYERRGLIKPRRSRGNIRLFTSEDLEKLKLIRRLIDDLGVNLAGVEVILRMREQILEMQRRLEETEQVLARVLAAEKKKMG
ncbi:MAG: hypothetical protein KatS3mg057_0003 [Herpetosiphonaceae bacterium]|nr:MAG: hypothetical protein KatS3mg057_0003 [Herpetosiphonaceae bacterium]